MDIEVHFEGQPTRDRATAKATLTELLRAARGHVFYIGISADPDRRARSHRRIKVEGVPHNTFAREMHVIYETDHYSDVQSAEDDFIAFAAQFDGGRSRGDDAASAARFAQSGLVSWNSRAGGAGRRPASGPYYVYVLIG